LTVFKNCLLHSYLVLIVKSRYVYYTFSRRSFRPYTVESQPRSLRPPPPPTESGTTKIKTRDVNAKGFYWLLLSI